MLWKAGILRTCRDGWEVMPILFLFFATSSMANAQMPGQKAPGPPPAQIEQTSHGIRATAGSEVLEVTVCSDSVIHVVATPEACRPSVAAPVDARCPAGLSRERRSRLRRTRRRPV